MYLPTLESISNPNTFLCYLQTTLV